MNNLQFVIARSAATKQSSLGRDAGHMAGVVRGQPLDILMAGGIATCRGNAHLFLTRNVLDPTK